MDYTVTSCTFGWD